VSSNEKNAKLCPKGSVGVTWPNFGILRPPNKKIVASGKSIIYPNIIPLYHIYLKRPVTLTDAVEYASPHFSSLPQCVHVIFVPSLSVKTVALRHVSLRRHTLVLRISFIGAGVLIFAVTIAFSLQLNLLKTIMTKWIPSERIGRRSTIPYVRRYNYIR